MEQSTDKKLVLTISQAIQQQLPSVAIPLDVHFDDVRNTIRVYMRQHPEVFWFSHQYRFDESAHILYFKYNFAPQKKYFFEKEIKKTVECLFQPNRLMRLSDLEKVAYVYKWIVNNTIYNEYSSFNQTIFSVLINRNSVCTGYAKSAQYLLRLLGIESELVFGKFHADKSDVGRHGWNIVKIEGEWYHVDFCLADPSLRYLLNSDEIPIEHNDLLWNYFCKSTEYVLRNRSIEFAETYPKCVKSIDKLFDIQLLEPQDYLVVCKSDSGTTAKVFLDSYNKDRVVKISRNNRPLIDNETKILQRLKGCNHIVQYKGHNEGGIVLEQLTTWGELLNSHYYNPNEEQLKDILIQLAEGLIECRNMGITYTDIHYNNVFVSKDGTFKWGDFGIAYTSTSDGHLPPQMIGDDGIALGSRWFMAPETYHNRIYTETSAIYSMAMLAYFVMNDMRPPFWTGEEYQNEALAQRLNGNEIPAPVFINRYKDLWQLIRKILSYSADLRPCSYEDFISQIATDYAIIDGISDVDQEYSQMEEMDYENPIFIDATNDDCIDYSFASTEYIVPKHAIPIDDSPQFTSTMGGWGDGIIHDSDSFACTRIDDSPQFTSTMGGWGDGIIHDSDSFACTRGIGDWNGTIERPLIRESYGFTESKPTEKRSIWNKLFGKKEKTELVNASAYAPREIIRHKHFIIRIFIHRLEEIGVIDQIVSDIDKMAVKMANKPLDIPIKKGDKITIHLAMTGGIAIDEPIQEFTWMGHYIECDFGCELTNRNLTSTLGKTIVAINNVPCGDLKFTIDVVSVETSKVYAPVERRRYSKIFISYAHADYSQVRGIAEGCKMNGSDYFFDRHTLQAGDIFKDKILHYIDNADLFVLCWTKNAAKSEWVQIERKHALELIEKGNHQLTIYPLSMPPEAPLPADMSDKYNFATL
ncbi:MAG: TIR domain-containing protein [Muribaculaceae bacterium]|nr:TIR domain-containing protein [Muribaculaceae bacterium]